MNIIARVLLSSPLLQISPAFCFSSVNKSRKHHTALSKVALANQDRCLQQVGGLGRELGCLHDPVSQSVSAVFRL